VWAAVVGIVAGARPPTETGVASWPWGACFPIASGGQLGCWGSLGPFSNIASTFGFGPDTGLSRCEPPANRYLLQCVRRVRRGRAKVHCRAWLFSSPVLHQRFTPFQSMELFHRRLAVPPASRSDCAASCDLRLRSVMPFLFPAVSGRRWTQLDSGASRSVPCPQRWASVAVTLWAGCGDGRRLPHAFVFNRLRQEALAISESVRAERRSNSLRGARVEITNTLRPPSSRSPSTRLQITATSAATPTWPSPARALFLGYVVDLAFQLQRKTPPSRHITISGARLDISLSNRGCAITSTISHRRQPRQQLLHHSAQSPQTMLPYRCPPGTGACGWTYCPVGAGPAMGVRPSNRPSGVRRAPTLRGTGGSRLDPARFHLSSGTGQCSCFYWGSASPLVIFRSGAATTCLV